MHAVCAKRRNRQTQITANVKITPVKMSTIYIPFDRRRHFLKSLGGPDRTADAPRIYGNEVHEKVHGMDAFL